MRWLAGLIAGIVIGVAAGFAAGQRSAGMDLADVDYVRVAYTADTDEPVIHLIWMLGGDKDPMPRKEVSLWCKKDGDLPTMNSYMTGPKGVFPDDHKVWGPKTAGWYGSVKSFTNY